MVFDTFLHNSLIFISNTAYVEQAVQTKQLTDTLDALISYRAKARESVALSKEADAVRLYLQLIQAGLEGQGVCELSVYAGAQVRIRHGALLDSVMTAMDCVMRQEEVHTVSLRVEEKAEGLSLRLFAQGVERCDASAWIEIQAQ